MPEYKLGKHRGKYCIVWYEEGDRKRRSLGTSDRKQADREFQRVTAEISRQIASAGSSVGELFAAYIADRKEHGKDHKRMEYALAALQDHFGHLDPLSITNKLCKAYIKKARERGKSNGTIHTELGYLRSAMLYAHKMRWLPEAPYIWLPSRAEPRERALTREEAGKLIDACEYPHLKLFVLLALYTGGRAGALLDLKWSRVDLERGQIKLHNPEREKTSKGRATIPINQQLRAALTEAREGALSDYVIEWGGERVGSIKKGFAAAAARAGFDDVTPHVLRHTAAVWMAESGIPLDEIAQYLGHSDPRTTYKVYARYSPSYLRKAAESLNL